MTWYKHTVFLFSSGWAVCTNISTVKKFKEPTVEEIASDATRRIVIVRTITNYALDKRGLVKELNRQCLSHWLMFSLSASSRLLWKWISVEERVGVLLDAKE